MTLLAQVHQLGGMNTDTSIHSLLTFKCCENAFPDHTNQDISYATTDIISEVEQITFK